MRPVILSAKWTIFVSTHLTSGKGPRIGHLGPWGPLTEPPNYNIYPRSMLFSKRINCQVKHFYSQPTLPVAKGHVVVIWDPGDPHQSPQTTKFTPETSLYSSTSNCLSKLPNEPFFPNPPQMWQGAMYWPSGTLGTPITVPKQ